MFIKIKVIEAGAPLSLAKVMRPFESFISFSSLLKYLAH